MERLLTAQPVSFMESLRRADVIGADFCRLTFADPHLPKGQIETMTFGDQTFADCMWSFAGPDICQPDICRSGHLPIWTFADPDIQAFAFADICRSRHLPILTFADPDICRSVK